MVKIRHVTLFHKIAAIIPVLSIGKNNYFGSVKLVLNIFVKH